MKPEKPQCCGLCAYAAFERTAVTRRPKANLAGRCTYAVKVQVPVPSCVAFHESRKYIWPKCGTTCPVFERAQY